MRRLLNGVRFVWCLVLAVAALWFTPSVAVGQQCTLDLQQNEVTYGFWFDQGVERWQTFVPTSGTLCRIDLSLWRDGNPGNVHVEVRNASGILQWERWIAEAEVVSGWTTVAVSPALAVTPGATYRILVRSDAASVDQNNRYGWYGQTESPYVGTTDVSDSWPGYAYAFRTYGGSGGGCPVESGRFSPVGLLSTARARNTATLLPNGRVLLAGGYEGQAPSSAEIYEPATGSFRAVGQMSALRYAATATLLPNGRVLLAGGSGISSADLYDPTTETFTPTETMGAARYFHTATLLASGQVLVAGGRYAQTTAEVYDSGCGVITVTVAQVDTSACSLVKAIVGVTDATGQPVTGLSASNFALTEDGAGQTITVTPVTSAGSTLFVALNIDNSASLTSSGFAKEKAAAKSFIALLEPGDQAAVYGFSNTVDLVHDFTSDKAALSAAIDAYGYRGGTTALYDSIYQSLTNTGSKTGRKAVIAMTDGEDTAQTRTQTEVIAYAKQVGVPVYTIGFGQAKVAVLQAIATQTGGRYYASASADNLRQVLLDIGRDINSQYEVSYTTSNTDGQTHNIDVVVTSNGSSGHDATSYQGCGAITPITIASVTASPASPQQAGTAITWTATATGGVAPLEYEFWLYNGSSWTMLRGYSTSDSATWTPATAGTYAVQVWVRSSGSTAPNEAAKSSAPFVVKPLPVATVSRMSVAAGGEISSSADGRYVVFATGATNLDAQG